MELVIRALAIYVALFVLMRAAGNRQFSKLTAFDAVLVILIAEVTGQALIGEDYSITGAVAVLAVIIGTDVLVSLLKHRSSALRKVVDGVPALLVNDGRLVERTLRKERVEREAILDAAREHLGIERLEEVKYAVLEPNGTITVVPYPKGQVAPRGG
jgi:uncharacterized membrane protein YcaP (DUF421 family)